MINNDEISFEHYNGMDVQQDKKLLQTIKLMLLTRNMDLNITNYLDEDSDIFFMYKNNKLSGFAWITICKELDMYLDNEIGSEIIFDRKKAIEKAIYDAKPLDVVLISGRGNKILLCDGKFSTRLIVDSEAVLETFRKDRKKKNGK